MNSVNSVQWLLQVVMKSGRKRICVWKGNTLPTAEISSGKNDVIFKKRIKIKILKQKSGSRLEVAC